MRAAIVLLIPTVLLSCNKDPYPYTSVSYTTPLGFEIGMVDFGSGELVDVPTLFDQAVEDAAIELAKYGVSYDRVIAAVHSYRWAIVDHFRFETAWSPTGYASGLEIPGQAIKLALYSRAYNLDGPPHTHVYWGGKWQSGCIPTALPALLHELLHAFGLIEENHKASDSVVVFQVE